MNRHASNRHASSSLRFSRRGFTLVEAVLSCLIISVVLVPALQLVGDSAKSKILQRQSALGAALARELMSEILQCNYVDPNVDTGEVRSGWDDIHDYDGYVQTSPTDRTGTALPGYTNWIRKAAIRYVTLASPGTTSATDVGLKEIVVTVTSPTGRIYTLTALRSNNDGYERKSVTAETYTSSIDITLQTADGVTVTTSANTINLVP